MLKKIIKEKKIKEFFISEESSTLKTVMPLTRGSFTSKDKILDISTFIKSEILSDLLKSGDGI